LLRSERCVALASILLEGLCGEHVVAVRALAVHLAAGVSGSRCALAVLGLSVGRLSAVAGLVAHSCEDVALLDAAAALFLEEELINIEDLGGVDLSRTVACKLRVAIHESVAAAAVEVLGGRQSKLLAASQRRVGNAASTSRGVASAVHCLVQA